MTAMVYQVRRWLHDGREFVLMRVGHWPGSVCRGEYADGTSVWATVDWVERGSEVVT